MSTIDGAGAAGPDGQTHILQIYPRLPQDAASCCTLQATAKHTAATVIENAVATLGLDGSQAYSLLELRESGAEERPLEAGDRPVERLLLWPPEARKWHPQSHGYCFILQNRDGGGGTQVPDKGEDYDDLCNLPTLTDNSILEALRQRFYKKKIYTYARSILIAVNPYKFLPVYYNPKYVKMYENQPLGKLCPHIFAIADVAYRAMLNKQANQCIVISGESGSGKTESTSYLVHCLTALSQKHYSSGVERPILGASPVLEAFGNAKTAQNNNSSRFGNFIQLNYLESGVIRGAVIEKHLLEKSRLVFRDKSERNFHVFYYLLVGASKEEQKEFQLLQPQEYLYLKQEDFCLEDEEKLRHEYKRLHQAMEMVGFLASTKKQIFSILSAILYLGNVTYSSSEGQVLDVGPADVLSTLSNLLKVKKELLVHTLTKRKTVASNGSAASQYTITEASKARDSLAMSLYGALFDWIVLHVNHALLNRRDAKESVSCLSIGVLDMFGFQNLQINSFEQFCVNFANEKLQHHFSQHIFKQQQEEYVAEGIRWQTIDYTDNMGCIDLISGKPIGVFHLLDEESNLPQASDDTLLEKLKQHHESNPLFVTTAVKEPAFVIQHSTGRVKYQIKDFLKKNTARMRPDVVSLLRGSERAFLRQLVASSPVAVFRWGILRATVRILAIFNTMGRQRAEAVARRSSWTSRRDMRKSSTAMDRLSSSNSQTLDFSFDRSDEHPLDMFEDIFTNYEKRRKNRGSRQKQLIPKNLVDTHSLKHIVALTSHNRMATVAHHHRLKPPSLSAQFQASFGKLLETIGKAEPFFIHCIHSNAEKEQMHFDANLVLQQIKSTGLVEVVRIQKASFGAKFTFKEFVRKFRILLPKGARAAPEDITELLQKTGLDQNTYQIGKTKVFLKERERQRLQDTLNKEVMRHIVILQRWFRSCLIRTHFLQKKDAAMLIQRSWRGFYETNQSRAAVVIQTAWRTSQKRKDQSEQDDAEKKPQSRPGPRNAERKELKRQQGVELIPSRKQQPQKPKPRGLDQDLRDGEKREREREGRGSPPPLNRPFSLPMDHKHGDHSSSLQRYTNNDTITEMGNKWRERRSEGELADDSSPESRPPRNRQKDAFQNRGKSMSVDELSKLSSSGSDSSPSTTEVRLRSRKRPPRRRRLAYARSGLMFNLGGSKESEFWSYPLPPISPQGPALKCSASSVDVRAVAHRHEFKILAEPDGSRFSLPARSANEGSAGLRSQPTPGLSFFSRFIKKRATRDSEIMLDKDATLASYSPQPYRMPAQNSVRAKQHPTIRISRATRVEQWNTSLDREITDSKELRNLDEFLGNQVNDLHTRIKELSDTERIFLMATKEFRDTIKSMYSFLKPQISYKDLMKGYQNKVNSLAGSNQKTEVTLVVNLFQSVLDGFIRREMKREEGEPVKSTKKTKKRRKREKCMDSPLDHMFSTYQVNIMQSCDLCGSFIWGMEKAYMCSACKLICHKKCLNKVITDCLTRCARKDDSMPGSLHFGVQVCVLTSKAHPVPKVVEMLLMHVEMNGLYSEGIYRKSGSACRARELHQILETNPEEACLENYPIHTITGLVKRWLRELPDPLMTFNLYNDFLHATELPEKSERMRAVYQKVDELPIANYNTLERLIFHLVKVAKEEEHNRMTPNSLAIVFAPCILRSPNTDDPFLGIKDVSKTTMCLEILITEQFRRYKEKMHNIKELEYAETLAVNQLKLRRQNTIEKPTELDVPDQINYNKEAEKSLIERIRSIKQEKEELAYRLPDLEQEQSDNDNLDSESSMSSDSLTEDHLGSLDSEEKWAMRPTKQKPECPPKPPDLVQRVKCLMGQTEEAGAQTPLENHAGHLSEATGPQSPKPGQARPSASINSIKSQIAGKSFNGSLDIPFIDDDL